MLHICFSKPWLRMIRRKYGWRCILIMTGVCFVWFQSGFPVFWKSSKDNTDIDIASVILHHDRYKRYISERTCIHPQLQLYHPSVQKYFYYIKPVQCGTDKNWIIIENGTFLISEQAQKIHGRISCQFAPIYREKGDDSFINSKPLQMIHKTVQLPTDFLKVSCVAKDGSRYFNIHAGISYNRTIHERINKKNYNNYRGMNLSVLMFGFDSVSRMTWKRKLPKTHEYFTKVLRGVVLQGYNIVGDGTPQALLPILTGKKETELPESRRGKDNAKSVDRHPWIWKDFQNAGYVTQWTEDMAHIGTFNYRMKGFIHQPVDHYMRPFYLAAEKMYSYNKPYCLGSEARHKVLINWLRDTFLMYRLKKKFIFGFHSEYSHENANNLQWADEDLFEFLKFLHKNGYLNETILILMSDHGARFHAIRETVQGKLEERMPYFAFRFPPWFKQKFPKAFENFKINSKQLTTPFDIYETFRSMINFTEPKVGNLLNRGISLFDGIPKKRSCAHAGIASHWCACLQWNNLNISSQFTKTAAKEAVTFINGFTLPHRDKCYKLSVSNISKSLIFKINKNVTIYTGSKDEDGRLPEFKNSQQTPSNKAYQITFMTSPGGGKFEVTYMIIDNHVNLKFVFSANEISRINKYGHTADCISSVYPHLRQYCYCKNNSNQI